LAEKDGKRIAIEIETGKSDAVYNVRKDLEAGFGEVVVYATHRKVKSFLEDFFGDKEGILSEKIFIMDNSVFLM